jgi:predicted DNA binding protein
VKNMSYLKYINKNNPQVQHLLISIRLPNGHWAGDITRLYHHTAIRVDEHMPLPNGRGSAKCTITGEEINETIESLRNHNGVEEIVIYENDGDLAEVNVTIAKAGGGFLKPLMKANVAPRTPFKTTDGWVDWNFVTDLDHLQILIKGLKESGIPHKIHSFSKEKTPRLLTPRQREIFDYSVRYGYYDSPRKITLTNLAKKVGVSKSTLCEMIHLIEKKMIEAFADQIREQSPKE